MDTRAPKMDARATARPAIIRGNKSPPSVPGSPPQTRSRANENLSPLRRSEHRQNDKSHDEVSGDEEDLDNNQVKDEVDRAVPRNSPQSGIYPDLASISDSESLSGWSPTSKREHGSPEESFSSSQSQCIPRRGATGTRKGTKAEVPLTPKKGTPGKKIYPPLGPIDGRTRRGMTPLMSIAFLFLIFFGCITVYQSLQNVDELPNAKPYVKPIKEVHEDIKRELRVMVREFSQTRHFWVQLMGQLDTIMNDDPIQPAVILAVVPEGAAETGVCLLHKVSQAVTIGFEDARFVMYDVKSELRKGRHHLKRDLYNSLLKLDQSHAAIVHDIEIIPGEAAMTFHAFCDNENAPFKQALIILVVNILGKYEDLSWERVAHTIDDYLKGKWGEELSEKDVSAVVSRVANAPVLITPESSSVLSRVCENI